MSHLVKYNYLIKCFIYKKVLSSTVADMLEEQELHSTKSLIKFIRMMDKFFDCLNVSKIFNYSRKPDLDIYKSIDDARFNVSYFMIVSSSFM